MRVDQPSVMLNNLSGQQAFTIGNRLFQLLALALEAGFVGSNFLRDPLMFLHGVLVFVFDHAELLLSRLNTFEQLKDLVLEDGKAFVNEPPRNFANRGEH